MTQGQILVALVVFGVVVILPIAYLLIEAWMTRRQRGATWRVTWRDEQGHPHHSLFRSEANARAYEQGFLEGSRRASTPVSLSMIEVHQEETTT